MYLVTKEANDLIHIEKIVGLYDRERITSSGNCRTRRLHRVAGFGDAIRVKRNHIPGAKHGPIRPREKGVAGHRRDYSGPDKC